MGTLDHHEQRDSPAGAAAPARAPVASDLDLVKYETARAQVQHEDQLLGVRVGWLIGAEAFLFGAYATTLRVQTATADPRVQGAHDDAARLARVLPYLGVVIAGLVLCSIIAAVCAIHVLRRSVPRHLMEEQTDLPSVIGKGFNHALGLVPVFFLPIALIIAWTITAWA